VDYTLFNLVFLQHYFMKLIWRLDTLEGDLKNFRKLMELQIIILIVMGLINTSKNIKIIFNP